MRPSFAPALTEPKETGRRSIRRLFRRPSTLPRKAGGTVVFAPGVYLTGSLFLKSGTELRVDAGVEIRGVQDLAAYPVMQTRVAGVEMKWPAALINVYEQSHVKISGKGVIDGDGKIWWDKYWALRKEYEPKGLRWAADYDCQRPRLIVIYKSSDVDLRGPGAAALRLLDGAHLLLATGARGWDHHPQQHRRQRSQHRRHRYRLLFRTCWWNTATSMATTTTSASRPAGTPTVCA